MSETDFGQAWTVEKGEYVEIKNLYRLYVRILYIIDYYMYEYIFNNNLIYLVYIYIYMYII